VDIEETNRRVIEQFRAGGPIEGMHREALLLLTTAGRRTGRRRTSPMMFERDQDGLVVIASNMGADKHPSWYLNLLDDPHVHVEIGDDSYDATAATLTGAERDRRWAELVDQYPFFAEHQSQTVREIPLVRLTRDPSA
jgi:deazaflavin-dependent oxidoreductase (nitroreductase family)